VFAPLGQSLQADTNWVDNPSAEIAGDTPDHPAVWQPIYTGAGYKRIYFSDPVTGANWAPDGHYVFQLFGDPARSGPDGIYQTVELNQTSPRPVRVSALCAPYMVQDVATDDYGQTIGYHIIYADATDEWSHNGPNNKLTGTLAGWYRHQLNIVPMKPIASLEVYLYVGAVTGLAQFDDVRVEQFNPALVAGGAVTFVVDDGEVSTLIAHDKLAQRGWVGTAAIITDSVGTTPYMSLSQLNDLYQSGWSFLSHSKTHPDMTTLSDAEAGVEFGESRDFLRNNGLAGDDLGFVWPFGANNLHLTVLGGQYGLTSFRPVTRGYNPQGSARTSIKIQEVHISTTVDEVMTWVNTAEQSNQWLVLVFHSIVPAGTHADQYYTTPETFQEIVDLVGQKGLPVIDYYEGLRRFCDSSPLPKAGVRASWTMYE